MQDEPRYDDVVLDVYDALEARIEACERAGIARARLIVDPGIGFGKTLAHNLALLGSLSLFHGLGCAVLLGASRKSFIGHLTGADADDRLPGSLAAALLGAAQGVQLLRVHDVAATRQALAVWEGRAGRTAAVRWRLCAPAHAARPVDKLTTSAWTRVVSLRLRVDDLVEATAMSSGTFALARPAVLQSDRGMR